MADSKGGSIPIGVKLIEPPPFAVVEPVLIPIHSPPPLPLPPAQRCRCTRRPFWVAGICAGVLAGAAFVLLSEVLYLVFRQPDEPKLCF